MSLAFQNAESIKQALFEELQNLLSSERGVLAQAEQRIKQLECTEGFGVYLAEFIMNQSFELPLRQIACIMLTRYVENHWCDSEGSGQTGDSSISCTPSEQAKRTIRNILPNGLYDPNSKIRNSVAHSISTIAMTDWPTVWTELFDIIIKCLGGNENSIHGAMQILVEFSYDEKQIQKLGPVIVSEIYRIFDAEQNFSIKTRACAIRILKSLFLSIKTNISNKQEKSTMVNSILSSFMDKALYYLSMNSGNSSNFLLRTEIVKVLTFLLTDLPTYIEPLMESILPIIWQLLTQVADIYVKVIVNQTEPSPFTTADNEEDDEEGNFTTMLIQIFEFIQSVICSTRCHTTVKSVLQDLIYIVIVYIQTTEQQIDDWSDPDNFVEDEYFSGVEITIRFSGQDVLVALNEDLSVDSLQALQDAISRHMSVAEAEKAAGNPHWWKIYDACTVAMTAFTETIMENQDAFDLVNFLNCMRNLLTYRDQPFLVGRAVLSLSTFMYANVFDLQMLEHTLAVTQECLSREKPMVMKILAVKAIYNYVDDTKNTNEDKKSMVKSKLSSFFEGMFGMITGTNNSTLAHILEVLTSMISFDQGFTTALHHKLIPLALAIFLKYNEDPFLLEIIQDLVKELCQTPTCLQPLQEKFIPTTVSMLSGRGESVNSALEVLTTIVRYAQAPLPDAIIETAFPAMVRCVLQSDDNSVMVTGGECLRAFIFVAPEQVCAYKNGEGLNYIIQVTTMLLNPMNNEMTAGQIGRLVITIIIKMGNMLGENMDLLLKAVISKMQMVECLKVIMSLVVVFAHLFLTQMDAVLNFLSTLPGPTGEPAMLFVFNNWLAKQTYFFGSYEHKVTTMALCKLFEYGITTQDTRITSITFKELVITENVIDTPRVRTRSQTTTSKQWVTMPVLVKIFKLLIHELAHLKEVKYNFDSDDDDDDDEDDDPSISDCVAADGAQKLSPTKAHCISDLYFNDDDEENADDDQLMAELMKDPLFQANIEENLTKFLQNFSSSEHFAMFASQLNDAEKHILKQIQVKV